MKSDREEFLRKMQNLESGENPITFTYRIMEAEVHSLEMVDQILSAIESQKKLSPKKTDTILVKKALHNFLQASKQPNPEEASKAEFALMDEIENWHLNLAQRDKAISSEDLRFYCEHSKPPLSPYALLALSRFYLALPFSVATRTKFDIVVTKLFTAELWDGRRELTEPPEKIAEHLSKAYKNWTNAPSFSAEDTPIIEKALVNLRKFIDEAAKAEDLDELLAKNLFREFYNFKNNLGERFFEPSVVAASIECNVVLGNRYDELLRKKANSLGKKTTEKKYESGYDKTISEAVGMTLNPTELLEREKPEKTEEIQVLQANKKTEKKTKPKKTTQTKEKTSKEKTKKSPFCKLVRYLSFC